MNELREWFMESRASRVRSQIQAEVNDIADDSTGPLLERDKNARFVVNDGAVCKELQGEGAEARKKSSPCKTGIYRLSGRRSLRPR